MPRVLRGRKTGAMQLVTNSAQECLLRVLAQSRAASAQLRSAISAYFVDERFPSRLGEAPGEPAGAFSGPGRANAPAKPGGLVYSGLFLNKAT
jgi:hypothetical protein